MPDRPDAHLGWDAADRVIADAIVRCRSERARPILAGLSGAQGSGKSTLAARLPSLLADRGLRTAVLALDDFYLTRAARQALARSVHPLFATRGVPGTHDIALLDHTITAMLQGQPATVPRFEKATDDRRGTEPIDGQPATAGNGSTIGFKCGSPEQVQRFHDVAVAHGGASIEEPPGPRTGPSGVLHLAYVRDPDGHKLCALHRPAS